MCFADGKEQISELYTLITLINDRINHRLKKIPIFSADEVLLILSAEWFSKCYDVTHVACSEARDFLLTNILSQDMKFVVPKRRDLKFSESFVFCLQCP